MITTSDSIDPQTYAAVRAAIRDHLQPHPRLVVDEARIATLRKLLAGPGFAGWWLAEILSRATTLVEAPPLRREMEGRRLLAVSRDAMSRLVVLASAFRLTSDPRFLNRARVDLLTAARFDDFNPSHFLDVSEMVAGLAFGYDWLFEHLSEAERFEIRRAIATKGIEPSYDPRWNGWLRAANNWNAVCHGGLVLGALAIAEHFPEDAETIVARCLACAGPGLNAYAPDGVYPEGVGYWSYGTHYLLLTATGMRSAVGSDFGLLEAPGVLTSGRFVLHATGPTGEVFNFGDCGRRTGKEPLFAIYDLAERTNDPSLLWHEAARVRRVRETGQPHLTAPDARFLPLLLRSLPESLPAASPTELHFAGTGETPVATHRTTWTADATYVAIKGGQARTSHAHLDAGTFVMDALGERWAIDLGAQDYHSIESRKVDLWDMGQQSPRWSLFRLGAMSHNIIVVDAERPRVEASVQFVSSTAHASVLDTTALYGGTLRRSLRAVQLLTSGRVRVQDQLEAAEQEVTLRWAFLTDSAVEPQPDGSVLLRRNGKQLKVRSIGVLHPALSVLAHDPAPLAIDAPNPGVSIIGFHMTLRPNETVSLAVEFAPVMDDAANHPEEAPLLSLGQLRSTNASADAVD